MIYKAVPEWENPKDIYIVNPQCIPILSAIEKWKALLNMYDKLIYFFAGYTNVNVIVCSKYIDVDTTVPFDNFKVLCIPPVRNIWIRDWAPIPARDEFGSTVLMKFIYEPAYQSKAISRSGNRCGYLLSGAVNLPRIDVPLILDGGNFTHNGEGIAIVSNRVISDNENYSIREIEEYFREYLGIDKLIFIPVEPGDATGHTDGTVRFIDNKTLLVGDYPAEYSPNVISGFKDAVSFADLEHIRSFNDKLSALLQNELGPEYKIVRLVNAIPRNAERKDDIAPAFGNYINFVRLGNEILLPQYNIPEDYFAEKTLKENFKDLEITPVCIDGISELSFEGGVLNCITWVTY